MRATIPGPQARNSKFAPIFERRHGWVSGMNEHLWVLRDARAGSHSRLVHVARYSRSARLTSVRTCEESSRFWDCKTDVAGPNWARLEVHARLREARAGAPTTLWFRART